MRLIVECEHVADRADPENWCGIDWCNYDHTITDPDAILAALAEAGVLEVDQAEGFGWHGQRIARYVSPWKEAK